MVSQVEKAARFVALHQQPGAFIIPNPWDAGTARLLTSLGFEALATTSLGLAITFGRATVTPAEIIANCKAIADATSLPVNADLENCGAHEPRAENLLNGRDDLDDTIRRLQAFEAVGADVLYAPGLKDLATIKTVVQAVTKPVNVVMSHADSSLTLADLAAVGVRRVSVGGSISRFVMASFLEAGREMKDRGAFTFIRDAAPARQIMSAFASGR